MSKEVEIVTKTLGELQYWCDETQGYVEKFPSGLYIINALGDYVFFMTRDRKKAQEVADREFGVGKYKVRTTSDKKTKSRQENGQVSVRGTNSRKGFASHLRPTT